MTRGALTFASNTGTLPVMNAWSHSVMAAMLVLVLANPLCACDAPMPVTESPEPTGCCSSSEGSGAPEPVPADSSAPGPCDCETAVHEGLLQAKRDVTKPVAFAMRVSAPIPFRVATPELRPTSFDRADFQGPPLRHRYSIYRL